MIYGFTGTRNGMTEHQKQTLELILRDCTKPASFHHGGCRGADRQAHCVAFLLTSVVVYPGDADRYRKWEQHLDTCELRPWKPYLERNHDIVDACEILIAAPKSLTEELRSGTWATIRYARKIGRPVIILDP